MNPYHLISRNHDHFAHMSRIEDRRRDFRTRPGPLDGLISLATLKVVNAVERGWRAMKSRNRP